MSGRSDIPGFDEHPIDNAAAGNIGASTPLLALMDICPDGPNPTNTVLGKRFLCIGGGMLFVGPSGIGKSSASVQQDILWSLGRAAFDITPARPLRILTIQAENDAEDLAEMRDGVLKALTLSPEDRETLRKNVFYDTVCGLTGTEFLRYVARRLAEVPFDMLRIDPLLAYLGADINNAEQTAAFLRTGLNPLLAKHRVACILNHHTPKVTNRDASNWRASDWMYSGAGSADVTNWARAALVIDPTHANHVFRFIAAKRGTRIGWVDKSGAKEITRHFCHSSDGIYWRDADDADIAQMEAATLKKTKRGTEKTADDLRRLIPLNGTISKNELLERASEKGIGKTKARTFLERLLADKQAFVSHRPRAGTNPERFISREKQKEESDA